MSDVLIIKHSEESFQKATEDPSGRLKMAIDKGDPRYRGGKATIAIRWLDSPPGKFAEGTGKSYGDLDGLEAIVKGKIASRSNVAKDAVVRLSQEYNTINKELGGARLREIKAELERLDIPEYYIWRHIKYATWRSEAAARAGQIPKGTGLHDEVHIIPVGYMDDVDKLNEKAEQMECRPYDGTNRIKIFDWRPVTPIPYKEKEKIEEPAENAEELRNRIEME